MKPVNFKIYLVGQSEYGEMVIKYKKTKQGTWDENDMQTANNLCKAGDSMKSTTKRYGLANATLYRHVKTGITASKLGQFRPVFTEDQKIELVTYLKDMDSVFLA
ncbi:hypothetical protein HHI36_001085 [Cryptolaemus montrouzieri]|uniref:HTH psq-type domain-containing protein n=1 Tax=Cryptolaemus montrouzieri TaxID=559131 RepID=A0ABD2P6Y9_9CUCU